MTGMVVRGLHGVADSAIREDRSGEIVVAALRAKCPTPTRARRALAACATTALLAAFALPPASVAASVTTAARLTYIRAPANSTASPQVGLAHANGTSAKSLGPASTAVLSPDGAYVAAVGPGPGSPAHGSSLVLYAIGSKKPARTLRSSAAQLTILAWAPDDEWIAVADGSTLVGVPLHGKPRTITSGTIAGASFAPRTPDRLVFSQGPKLTVGAAVTSSR